jgi:hypothetical protein
MHALQHTVHCLYRLVRWVLNIWYGLSTGEKQVRTTYITAGHAYSGTTTLAMNVLVMMATLVCQ